MSHFIKVDHSYTTKDLAAVYRPSGNFQCCPFFSLEDHFKNASDDLRLDQLVLTGLCVDMCCCAPAVGLLYV